MSHSDNVVGKIYDEGDLACTEEFRDEELIKIYAREDGHRSAGIIKIGDDRSLVFELIDGEVDEAKWPPFLSREVARHGG